MNKPGNALEILKLAALALLAFCLSGCMSTGYNKGDSAAHSLDRAAAEVQGQSHALDLTLAALSDLVNNPAPDLKPQFANFSHCVDQLVASSKRSESAATNVNRKGTAYFDAWETQLATVKYDVIRNQGEARRTEVKKNFDDVESQYHEAQSALLPLIDYLQDVRKTLSADLTLGGLQSAKPFLANAQENATKVQTALAKVSTQLASSGASLSTVLQTAKVENTASPPPVSPHQQASEAKQASSP